MIFKQGCGFHCLSEPAADSKVCTDFTEADFAPRVRSRIPLGVSCSSALFQGEKQRGVAATQGVITTSRLEGNWSWKDEKIEGFYPLIGYDYYVGGVKFHGTRISFNNVPVAVLEAWQPVVDKYPVGKNVAVYYDPKEPGFAVLHPGLFGEMHILYVMCIVLLILFGSLFLLVLFRT